MSHRIPLLGGISLIFATTMVLSASTLVLADEDSRPTDRAPSVEEMLREDAARHAEASGEDFENVLKEMAFQDEAAPVITEIVEKFGEGFSMSAYPGDGTLHIYFTGEVPSGATELVAGDPRFILHTNAKLTEHQAAERNLELFTEVSKLKRDGVEAYSAINAATGEVELILSEQLKLPEHLMSADWLSVEVDPSLRNTAEVSINGGDTMVWRNTTSPTCTAGFPAYTNAAEGRARGMLTADHCDNDLSVNGGDNRYNASKFMAHSKGDVQWHKAKPGVTVNTQFRYMWGAHRPVKSHPPLSVGEVVCRMGDTTGNGNNHCPTVKYVQACTTYSNLSYELCELAMTNTWTASAPGDSGGPWFRLNQAFGIHSGTASRDGITRNWFTSSRKAVLNLDLTGMGTG